MATLTAQSVVPTGLNPTYSSAAGGGDEFANTGEQVAHIKNGGAGAINVTFVTAATSGGLAIADQVINIPASGERLCGPFNQNLYNDSNNRVQITYDGVDTVTIAIFKV